MRFLGVCIGEFLPADFAVSWSIFVGDLHFCAVFKRFYLVFHSLPHFIASEILLELICSGFEDSLGLF